MKAFPPAGLNGRNEMLNLGSPQDTRRVRDEARSAMAGGNGLANRPTRAVSDRGARAAKSGRKLRPGQSRFVSAYPNKGFGHGGGSAAGGGGLSMRGCRLISIVVLAMSMVSVDATAKPTPTAYILNGFSLSGVPNVKPDDLIALLKDKPGARITGADIIADQKALVAELKARHIDGQLFTTTAEKHGRVWVLFDFQPDTTSLAVHLPALALEAQVFQGNRAVTTASLMAATGLKPGDVLGADRMQAARQGIARAYGQALPGAKIRLKSIIHRTEDGKAILNWTVIEPS